jgi:hypothetical protein
MEKGLREILGPFDYTVLLEGQRQESVDDKKESHEGLTLELPRDECQFQYSVSSCTASFPSAWPDGVFGLGLYCCFLRQRQRGESWVPSEQRDLRTSLRRVARVSFLWTLFALPCLS